jgi:hypothetical protein
VWYFAQLYSEFGFWVLSAKLSDLCNSPERQIYLLKSSVLEQTEKQAELNTLINRQTGLLEDVATLIRVVDSKVTEMRSDVTQMSATLTQIDSNVSQVDSKVNQLNPLHSAVGQLRTEISVLKVLKEPQLIVGYFPPLFEEFRRKRFNLLWRGSRDGFTAQEFHLRWDGRANTLTVISDTDGNVFGGFTPVKWESPARWKHKVDDSLQSFLFTLRNLNGVPPRKVALRVEKKPSAIDCTSSYCATFGDWISVLDNCSTHRELHSH